jgi:hypothetical protein
MQTAQTCSQTVRTLSGLQSRGCGKLGLYITCHDLEVFGGLRGMSVGLIITFTRQAQHRAIELTWTLACQIECWPTPHTGGVTESRDAWLEAYMGLHDGGL